MHRYLARLVPVALAIGFVAALANECAADPQGKRIAHLTTRLESYTGALANTLSADAKKKGMDVTTFSSPFNPALQAQQMDDAIARKFDMIILVAVSATAIVPAATRAHEGGIPIIVLIVPPKAGTESLYLSYVGEDQRELGRIVGKSVVTAFKDNGREGGKVAAITGSLQDGIGPLRLEGFKQELAANSKIELAAVEDVAWDPVKSQTVASQLFARFAAQGGLSAMYGMNDAQALAIGQAATAAGLTVGSGPKDLLIVGGNCTPQTPDAIRSGRLYSSASQIPTFLGDRAIDVAAAYFSGQTVEKTNYIPVEVINKSNIDKWTGPCSY
jgi:ABC-type sugar transport system substrate-binding protein